MKKLTTLFVSCLLMIGFARAQYVSIPDNNFRTFLMHQFPNSFNGQGQMDTTSTEVLTTDSLSTYYNLLSGSIVDTIHFQGLQYFKNLKFLYIEPMMHVGSAVIDSNILPNGIKTLQFGGLTNVIFSTSKLPDSLINFINNHCSLFSGNNVVFPAGFKNLNYSGTKTIDNWINGNTYPNTMDSFIVSALAYYSPLTNLPTSLKTFTLKSSWGVTDFSYMNLPTGLQNLSFIDANGNLNTNTIILPKLPASLKSLSLNSTKTYCLPILPDSLQILDITGASVSCISKLPNPYLQVTPNTPVCNATNNPNSCTVYNNYVNIPDSNFAKYLIGQIPSCLYKDTNNMYWMDTTCNSVSSITYLDVSNNNINDLSGLIYFKKLNTFISNNNILNIFPAIPNSIQYLECNNNSQLSRLPILPSNLINLTCDRNPNLFCLPVLPNSLKQLFLHITNILCMPNSVAGLTIYDSIYATNIPVCNATNNANLCQPFPIVHGKVFTDENSNGLKDGNEYYRPYVQLNASNGTSVVTNTNGEYTLALTDTGTYTLTAIAPAGFKAWPASNTFTFTNNVASLTLPDIAMQPINTNDSLTTFIMPLLWAKPGQELQYAVSYENEGTVHASDTVKMMYDTAHLIFDSCSMSVISHSGNTIIAIQDVLEPGVFNYFFAYFTIKPTAVMGDSIFATATISSPNTTATSATYQYVVSSYDPNYKDATPELSPVQVVNGTFIDYNIHFQNTGNDTAFNIVLADTLSPLLKSNILQVVATSHPCNVTMKDSIIYFEFLKINLPDSNTNNFRSNGFVHFRLLPQTYVPLGSRINNKASIYFDYNKPVVTNTASTLIKPYGVPVLIRNYSVLAERIGENQDVAVINNWTVSTEINTAYYTVQRSINGRDFDNAGKVIATNTSTYSFTDMPPSESKVLYYRLKINDRDGRVAYSDIKQVIIQQKATIVSVNPNPAKNFIMIKGNNVSQINMVDNTGRIILSRNGLNTIATENKVNINVADGIYMLQVIHTDGSIVNEKLIIKQ